MAARVERTEPPLIVIVGPTASGKTALAIELARQYSGEVICADSRTIYKGMDIGTAKPTLEEQALVPHWGLDLVEPGERFTAADFKEYATKKIAEIRAREHIPFLVGGTGLYINAVLFDYTFGQDGDSGRRQELEKMTIEELHKYCILNNIKQPENIQNKRYLIRAIEQGGVNKQRQVAPVSTRGIVGIATHNDVLRTRIESRAEQLFTNGVVKEATILGEMYGWENEAMTGNIYPLLRRYINGDMTVEDVVDKFTTLDWKLAKRQLTWFRRNPYVLWHTSGGAYAHIQRILANL